MNMKQNKNCASSNEAPNNRGLARVQFADQYEPISHLSYRFQLSNETLFEGETDDDGYTKTLINSASEQNTHSELIFYVPTETQKTTIMLEVKRDDGTWKNIGSFDLEQGVEKNIYARTSTTKLPFKLAPVIQNSDEVKS